MKCGSIKVTAPAYGNGTSGDVITITGTGFKTRVFGTANLQSQVTLVPAGTTIVAGTDTIPTTNLCASVQVESDTTLSCQLSAAVTDGAYSVVLFTQDTAAAAGNIGAVSAISRSATYTVSDF